MPRNAANPPSSQPPGGPLPPDDGQGSVVAERQASKVEPPRMYQVVMLNDDFTPMEFVVMVLQEFFHRDLETATHIMLKIHHEGRGGVRGLHQGCGRNESGNGPCRRARAGHPLQCIMEAT